MTEPTDAELGKLAEECGIGWGAGLGGMSDFLSTFARAVLAKWAAPQQEAQEPVAYVHVPHYTVEGKVRPVVSFEKYQQDYDDGIYSTRIPLYTAPQPVVRESLTDEQIAEMMRDTWGCASIAPRHALEFARAVERAHGIAQKGGSNADT